MEERNKVSVLVENPVVEKIIVYRYGLIDGGNNWYKLGIRLPLVQKGTITYYEGTFFVNTKANFVMSRISRPDGQLDHWTIEFCTKPKIKGKMVYYKYLILEISVYPDGRIDASDESDIDPYVEMGMVSPMEAEITKHVFRKVLELVKRTPPEQLEEIIQEFQGSAS